MTLGSLILYLDIASSSMKG